MYEKAFLIRWREKKEARVVGHSGNRSFSSGSLHKDTLNHYHNEHKGSTRLSRVHWRTRELKQQLDAKSHRATASERFPLVALHPLRHTVCQRAKEDWSWAAQKISLRYRMAEQIGKRHKVTSQNHCAASGTIVPDAEVDNRFYATLHQLW